LDLGCGNGQFSESFFRYGYEVTLVDKNEVLSEAENNFKQIKDSGFKTVKVSIEDFVFEDSYDGIIMSNVLPFVKDKSDIQRIVRRAFEKLNDGSFLFFTVFGLQDEWNGKYPNMTFCSKEEASDILEKSPYFLSEDYGRGSTMKGDIKTWHIFHLLYVR